MVEATATATEMKNNFGKYLEMVIRGNEVIITKNGKPVAQITPICKKNSKRVGAAKKEMDGFDISLEDFDAIPTLDFGL